MPVKISIEKADVKLILLDKEVIKADQDKIKGNLLSLDQSVHDNAVQCMLHAEKHGDTSLMRRLLVDILGSRGSTTGYRAQGLINWMRKHSPMELKGETINLSGILDVPGISELRKQYPELKDLEMHPGEKRPWLIKQANLTKFWTDKSNAEGLKFKPIFKDTAMSKVDAMYKEIMAAAENTVNGKPVDPNKPFYDGLHMDTVVDFAQKVKEMRDKLPADSTREVRLAQAKARELGEFIEANKDNVNAPAEGEVESLAQTA